jgi:CheY-like chemotaxis protein
MNVVLSPSTAPSKKGAHDRPAFPLTDASADAGPIRPSDARILIVDDSADNRDVLARRLRRLNYTCIEMAADGREALQRLSAGKFDVMLLDVMMPVLSGVETLRAMRAEGRLADTPVIMISAATDLDTVVRCLELGAEDYLPKPFNPVLLRARLGSVLEKKALQAALHRQLARFEAELAEARAQQLAMVPLVFPQLLGPVGVTVHAVMHPAREVGGDLYDVFELGENALCIAIGDVSDKGMPAALFMARTRGLLRAMALHLHRASGDIPRPSVLAALLNEELCKDNPSCMFVTLFVAFLDLRDGVIDYVNAGHLPPYVLDTAGAVTAIVRPPEPPVGVVEGFAHTNMRLRLRRG